MNKHIVAVVGIILSVQMYSLGNTASELYRAYVETALFEESSYINVNPDAGDKNAIALIKSSFHDGVPEAEKVLNLGSDTNLSSVVRNLALAEYVRRRELDLERIKSIPAKDWERIDHLTYMAMPPSELGFQLLSQFLSEYPEQEIPENDLAFVCAQYLCEGMFSDKTYKIIMTTKWSSYFSDLLFFHILFCDDHEEGEISWNARYVLSECVLNEFDRGKLMSKSSQLQGRFDEILEAKKIQLEVLTRAATGNETGRSPVFEQNRYLVESQVNRSRRERANQESKGVKGSE